jgi:hypothetical protein
MLRAAKKRCRACWSPDCAGSADTSVFRVGRGHAVHTSNENSSKHRAMNFEYDSVVLTMGIRIIIVASLKRAATTLYFNLAGVQRQGDWWQTPLP